MLKFIVAAVAVLAMGTANADSLAKASAGSKASVMALADGTANGVVHSWNGSMQMGKGISQLNAKGTGDGLSNMVTGSAEVVVASVTFLKDTAVVTFNLTKDSASVSVEVAKEVGEALYKGAKATLVFVANTAGDATVTFSGQIVFAMGELSQGNLNGSVQNIMLLPRAVWDALMNPDEYYAAKFN